MVDIPRVTSRPPPPIEPATATLTLSPTDISTIPPSDTSLPTFTLTLTPTSELQLYFQGPNEVSVPILLYHHIAVHQSVSTYYIPPDRFEEQMSLLQQWGYTTISVELLVKAIKEGAELPAKPIILTFDDGTESTYSTALPIMRKYNFTGVAYIVYNYIGANGYLNADQIYDLYASGWEIGSHSLSHADLSKYPNKQKDEIVESRKRLQSLLGIPILSFAYPYGTYNGESLSYVHEAGYIAAMGLGKTSLQGNKNLFYLSRLAVRGTDDLKSFALLLPWQKGIVNLPAVTPVP